MIIQRLRTFNFRNLSSEIIDLSNYVNAFTGMNAQGKTNVLEAISLLANGRSFRGSKVQNIIRTGEKEAAVEGDLLSGREQTTLKLHLTRKNRRFFVDGSPVTDLRQFLGKFSYVVFSAESMDIIDGDPQARRQFLDHGCFMVDPLYLLTLREFRKSLKSRNSVLKNHQNNSMLITSYDPVLCRSGAVIVSSRLKFLNQIKEKARQIHYKMSDQREQLDITYTSNWLNISQSDDVAEIELHLQEKLNSELELDIRRGFTGSGPHRDEIKVLINDEDIRFYGSRGQKRTAVISLKMAELEVFKQINNDYPVLLLDDIASEFDENRQNTLIREIPENIQVIISHTEQLSGKFPRPVQYYCVNDGCVTLCP